MKIHALFALSLLILGLTGPLQALDNKDETPWEPLYREVPTIANNLQDVNIETYYDHPEPNNYGPSHHEQSPHRPNNYDTPERTRHFMPLSVEELSAQGGALNGDHPEREERKRFEETYRLRIGDQLMISIYGEEKTVRPITVDPTGAITYQFVNMLQVEGKTIKQLRKMLQKRLASYYRKPLIIITLAQVYGDFYTVLGEVRIPGRKPIIGNATVLSALAQGGGFTYRNFHEQTIDQIDLQHSFLARDGDIMPVDFVKLVYEGDMTQNIPLQRGDYIYIAGAVLGKVYVLGEVGRNGTVDFFGPLGLANALAEAGGISPRASSRVIVIRGSLSCPTRYLIDINRILRGYCKDFLLESGDIVYVPPMRFTTIKEIAYAAARNFVGTVFGIAGTRAFLSTNPRAGISGGGGAAGVGVVAPIPTLDVGTNPVIFTAPPPAPPIVQVVGP